MKQEKEFLFPDMFGHGDIQRIARKHGYTERYVRMVRAGTQKNPVIMEELRLLAQVRKTKTYGYIKRKNKAHRKAV